MKNKKNVIALGILLLLLLCAIVVRSNFYQTKDPVSQTESIAVKSVSGPILADGEIHSENEATLHFQTAGKLVDLPVKEGDPVSSGQTIASLDTTELQQQLTQAYNTYLTAKSASDQLQENYQAGVLEGQQRISLDTSNKNGYSAIPETNVIYDTVQRLIEQNQLSLNSDLATVTLAQYAIQLATLTAPFDGIVTHMDISSSGVNVTPETSFIIANPNSLVFRTHVSIHDIDFVSLGAQATIQLDNAPQQKILGVVSRIYPEKIILPNGDSIYNVDVTADNLPSFGKLGQIGTAMIKSNVRGNVTLVPIWTVLSHNTVWVLEKNTPLLRAVTIGSTHGNMVEITHGLQSSDRIITNPESIASRRYQLL